MLGFSKEWKNLLNHTHFKDCASQKFVATILVTYVTILIEPDLALHNFTGAGQYDFFFDVLIQVKWKINLSMTIYVKVSDFARKVNFSIFQKNLVT